MAPGIMKTAMIHFEDTYSTRILDYLLTIPGLIIISPILLIISTAIKLDSPGPIIFKQKRVGRNGRIFTMYKFRSMVQNADQSLHKEHIKALSEGTLDQTNGSKMSQDPRITRLGRILRRSSLDELPQLFNVLLGDMSLVGPRPVPVYETDKYQLWQSERLAITPGMTGLWQVYGRGQTTFDDQIRLDIRYIRNKSVWVYLKLLLQTIPAVLSRRGAD
jgi:lipopolysaccharide/colanic/teichoic acid biosynthesis glycosyltransferase